MPRPLVAGTPIAPRLPRLHSRSGPCPTGTRRVWIAHRLAATSVIAGAALLLPGCASAPGERLEAIPTELRAALESGETLPTVMWAESPAEDWLVLTWGSSSCPTGPRDLVRLSESAYEIRLDRSGGPFCTADIGPTAYRIPAPVSRGTTVTVDVGPGTVVTLDEE